MTEAEQRDNFCNDLDALLNRYAEEYDLPASVIIAALAFKQHQLIHQTLQAAEEHLRDDDFS